MIRVLSSPSQMKRFVRGSSSDTVPEQPNHVSRRAKREVTEDKIDGADARNAYEAIISKDSFPNRKSGVDRRTVSDSRKAELEGLPAVTDQHSQPRQSATPSTLTSLMRHAEQNDCGKVMADLASNPSLLNAVDQYGWSPLMVAACAGAIQVVEFLLQSGADTRLRDRGLQSCVSLAKKRGHLHVAKLIQNYHPRQSIPEQAKRDTVLSSKNELCASCNMSFREAQKKSHLTSTVHQLSQCSKGCKTFYSIPGSNRGFQMMLKNGWDGDRGLGPSGSGVKFPPKTTLKRDRKGLGSSRMPARITHFQPNDAKAVAGHSSDKKITRSHQNKTHLNRQIQREKYLERSLRRELS